MSFRTIALRTVFLFACAASASCAGCGNDPDDKADAAFDMSTPDTSSLDTGAADMGAQDGGASDLGSLDMAMSSDVGAGDAATDGGGADGGNDAGVDMGGPCIDLTVGTPTTMVLAGTDVEEDFCFSASEGTAHAVRVDALTDAPPSSMRLVATDASIDVERMFSTNTEPGEIFDIAEAGGTDYRLTVSSPGTDVEFEVLVTELEIVTTDTNVTDTSTGPDFVTRRMFELDAATVIKSGIVSEEVCGRVWVGFRSQDGSEFGQVRSGADAVCFVYQESSFADLAAGEYVLETSGVDADSLGEFQTGLAVIEEPASLVVNDGFNTVSASADVYGDHDFYAVDLVEGETVNFVIDTSAGDYAARIEVLRPAAAVRFFERTLAFNIPVSTNQFTSSDDTGRFVATETGTYLVRVEATGSGPIMDKYELADGPYDVSVYRSSETSIVSGAAVSGNVAPYAHDRYVVDLAVGETLTVVTNNNAGTYLYTYIYGPDFTELDNDRSFENAPHTVSTTATVAGTYYVDVDPNDAISGPYTMTATVTP